MEEHIIEAVRRNPVLFDTTHPDFMKTKLKSDLWDKIAEKLNLRDGHEAKDTWARLRNCHRDALRRQRKGLRNGAQPHTLKRWKYQNKMRFLLPYMSSWNRGPNLDSDDDLNNVNGNEASGVVESIYLESPKIENEDSTSEINYEEENEDFGDYSMDTMPSTVKKAAQREPLKKRRRILESYKSGDPLYYFFLSMYQSTRNMPLASQHNVKNKVFQIVSQAEADLLNINSYQHSFTENQFNGQSQAAVTWEIQGNLSASDQNKVSILSEVCGSSTKIEPQD